MGQIDDKKPGYLTEWQNNVGVSGVGGLQGVWKK